MEKFLKTLGVRNFENNIFENKAGIQLPVIATQLVQNFIFKNVPVFEIFVNIVIQKLPCIQ